MGYEIPKMAMSGWKGRRNDRGKAEGISEAKAEGSCISVIWRDEQLDVVLVCQYLGNCAFCSFVLLSERLTLLHIMYRTLQATTAFVGCLWFPWQYISLVVCAAFSTDGWSQTVVKIHVKLRVQTDLWLGNTVKTMVGQCSFCVFPNNVVLMLPSSVKHVCWWHLLAKINQDGKRIIHELFSYDFHFGLFLFLFGL